MKRGEKRLLIFAIVMLLILLYNSFVKFYLSGLLMPLFLGVALLVFRYIFGFEKSDFRVTKETVLDTIIVVLVFFLLYYLFGLLISFAKVGNYYTLNGIANYILPAILTTIIREVLRFNYLVKSDGNKRLIIVGMIMFIFVDIASAIYFGNFDDVMHIFKFVALSLLPSISFNIYATYVSTNAGYKSILIYGLVTRLYRYMLPIVPNADEYLTSVVNFLLPIILLYRLYNTIKNESDEPVERDYNKRDYITIAVSALVVIVLVYFSSGYFKYHAIAIATGSMSPSIERGDVVIVKKTTNYDDIKVGEVIAYDYHNVLVVHRLTKKLKVDDEYYFYSRGDANKDEDNYIVKQDMIEGIVKYRIPFIGMPTVWLNELWEE